MNDQMHWFRCVPVFANHDRWPASYYYAANVKALSLPELSGAFKEWEVSAVDTPPRPWLETELGSFDADSEQAQFLRTFIELARSMEGETCPWCGKVRGTDEHGPGACMAVCESFEALVGRRGEAITKCLRCGFPQSMHR